MKLVDLRKVAIKKQQKIRFRLRNGMDGVVNELGVAQVPGLDRLPDFNLEQELEAGRLKGKLSSNDLIDNSFINALGKM